MKVSQGRKALREKEKIATIGGFFVIKFKLRNQITSFNTGVTN